MQLPAGYAIHEAGQFIVTDWWAVSFNPAFLYRLVPMLVAADLATAFVVGAVGTLLLLTDRATPVPPF